MMSFSLFSTAIYEHVFKFHPYEGHAMSAIVFSVRVMAKLGVKDLISESPILPYYLHLQLYNV